MVHGLTHDNQSVPLCLYDMKGQVVLSQLIDYQHPSIEINVPEGIYIVVINDGKTYSAIKAHLKKHE